jgi:hypothetical protein
MLALCLVAAGSLSVGCGASIPRRFVVEEDLGEFDYRRYQKTLDVEFPVEGNDAVGHTASYVRSQRTSSREVVFTTAFVTVYESSRGLTSEVRERLESLGTYDVDVRDLEGEYVWWLDGGDDRWAMWIAGRYLVKLGAPRGEEVSEEVADAYLDLYPSDLDEHGHARPGTPSYGPSALEREVEEEELDIPTHLREGAPR